MRGNFLVDGKKMIHEESGMNNANSNVDCNQIQGYGVRISPLDRNE